MVGQMGSVHIIALHSWHTFKRQFSAFLGLSHFPLNHRQEMKTKNELCNLRRRKRAKKNKEKRRDRQEVISPIVKKYWTQRYSLFSRYDEGIQMDEEGWYSVTPEEIAVKHAERCRGRVVIDCFSGVGGNAIQFARICPFVIAIDIDPRKIALAKYNAEIYGVEDRIEFIIGDFFQLAPSLKGDVLFLSPPWGGPSYKTLESYTMDLFQPKDGYSLFQFAQAITPDIIMFLPRNIYLVQMEELSWLSSPPLPFEFEENYVENYLKGITVYFGGTVRKRARLP